MFPIAQATGGNRFGSVTAFLRYLFNLMFFPNDSITSYYNKRIIFYRSQHTGAANGGGGSQALSGTGSCLKDFRSNPFIECKGGHCNFYDSISSFWLLAVNKAEESLQAQQQEIRAGTYDSRLSRCNVCIKE